ncbi:uncharacterized protein I206_104979 [Kwoniella pini CBS 10737]|uniref:DASH complex subunit SPC19 n=1 Tax=Kwoniella pini CBS 10737 TaxID=1296096 RepID=A0A1B9I8A4_9TREE|nr:DASH complex subunit SPC19 [Kwoniella pini CBS 10737]OCF51802.1 DASH complex subunit SPC19 [Kwoniella pini CBS 10737]
MAQYASSSKHLPRESIYPNPPSSDFLNALEDCVQATEGCSNILNNGLNKLNPGTKDLPRLTKIMNHKHHFLVLPEPTILAHKSALSTSLAPQIDQLIIKAENMVENEKLKLNTMEERFKILESVKLPKQIDNSKSLNLSLSSTTTTTTTTTNDELNKSQDISCKINDLNLKDLSILQRKKIMMLKNKRERLEKELERLKVVI